MFTEDGSICLVSREVVVVATVVQLVVITFITYLAVLYYYLRQDWQSARQVQDSAGKILSFRDSPKHRHGSNSKATRKWIISSIILVVILVAHYSDKILLFIWTPKAREFTRVAEIDLSIGYNSTIPYDLYQQYGDNKTMMPDMLLDSRYNPVLSQAGVTPSAIHEEEISYFTVDFDKSTILGRDKPLQECLKNPSSCYQITAEIGMFCSLVMWTDYSTATLARDPYACIPNSDRMAPSIGSLIPSVSYGIDNSGLMDMYVTGDDWDLVTPADNGETLYKFRISAIPYQGGHGLLLQYSITDTIVFTAPCCNQSSLWTPSNCTTLLSTYGFINTTAACHNATLGVDNYRIFIHTENGEYRHTMRYCVMYASGGFWVSVNCGVRHIRIQYLGPLTATPGKTYEYSIQPQGSKNAWCGMTNDKYICDSNSTGQIFLMVSYRGYGSHRTYYEVENTLELHVQDMNTTVGLIEDLYLREYYIGTDDPIYHGVKAPEVSYLTLSYFRADITVFIIAIALLVACIIAILVLHFRILPKYYTSSTLNVLRIATSLQGKRRMVKPGDADQIITVETTSIGAIILRNNGLPIGTTSNEYDLEATHSRFTSEDNLLSVVV